MRNIDDEIVKAVEKNPGLSRGGLIKQNAPLQEGNEQYIGLRLQHLCHSGFIRKTGERKGTRYHPCAHGEYTPVQLMRNKDTSHKIIDVFDEVKRMVVEKNQAYGDSIFKPSRVFYKGSAEPGDLIRIRMDDKISRLIQGDKDIGSDEDVIKDLMGYCAILLVTMREDKEPPQSSMRDYCES